MNIEHGIENLFAVEQDVFRGGQPDDSGWQWLKAQGVQHVIKLNTRREASDNPATTLGLSVHYFGIPWWRQTFWRPQQWVLVMAVQIVKSRTAPIFVHCEHGEDRTGLLVGCYRLSQGWTKDEAWQEMLAHGFHIELQGLFGRWNAQRPEDWFTNGGQTSK